MSRFTTSGADFSMPYAPARRDGARYQPLPNTPARPLLPVIVAVIVSILIAGVLYA